MQGRHLGKALAAGLLAVVGIVLAASSRGPSTPLEPAGPSEAPPDAAEGALADAAPEAAPPEPWSRPNLGRAPSPELSKLLGGLAVGATIEGATVRDFAPPEEGVVRVQLAFGQAIFTVGIGRLGSGGDKRPPISTERYEIGYSPPEQPPDTAPEQVPLGAIMRAFSDRIRQNEQKAAVPPGM